MRHTMRLQKHFYSLFIIISLLFSCMLCGCRQKSEVLISFDEFTEELFCEEITANTLNLHYTLAYPENFGIDDYPISLGSFCITDLEHYDDELLALGERLNAYDYSSLSTSQQLTYDIIADYIETELSAAGLFLYEELLSPTTGYQAQLPILLAEYTFRTERDISDYLQLCGEVEHTFDSILEFERRKSAAGLFMADFAADDIIRQMEDFIASPEDNYMIAVFNDNIDHFSGLSDDTRRYYKEKNYEIVTESIIPAYQKLIDGLRELKGTGKNPGGLCYFKNGAKYYEYLVKTNTGSSKSVRELQDRTEAFIYSSLSSIRDLTYANPHLVSDFYASDFSLTDPDEIMKDLISKVSEDFPVPPKTSYTIKYVHDSLADSCSPAFYLTPPIDDLINNTIYINPHYLTEDIYPTIAHEGYPGHLYQTVYTSSKNLPLVRHLFSYAGYSEGWATYVEYYSYHISGLPEDVAALHALNAGANLGLHAYVDLCVNYDGWDTDDVHEYLSQFGYTDLDTAKQLFRIMVEEPANYLSYFVGYLEFIELREEAEQLYGDEFSLKNFHDRVLSIGPAPFDILSKYLQTEVYAE